jgi:LmbE family N-acetylglucosaminyl deacetylase
MLLSVSYRQASTHRRSRMFGGALSDSGPAVSGQYPFGSGKANLPRDLKDETDNQLTGRVIVVSPHLDDAIMSLGSTIVGAVNAGAKVEILTVFADVASSHAPASQWDRQCGFLTEGQAANARREEDRRACAILGAEPSWLNFGSECYERRGTDNDIWAAVTSYIRGADTVLIPGFPLAHADHAYLAKILLTKGLNGQRIALYLEQPYSFAQKKTPSGSAVAPALEPIITRSLAWTHMRTPRKYRRTKAQAVRSYRSQLFHLGLRNLGLQRMLWREAMHGGEAIAWLRCA